MDEENDEREDFDPEIEVRVEEDTGLRHFSMLVSEGRRVEIRELTVAEFGAVVDTGGGDWQVVMKGLRRSLVSDRGEPLSADQKTPSLFAKRFNVREVMALRALWQQIHMIGEKQLSSIQGIRVG